MRAPHGLLGGVLAAHAGVEQGKPGHALGRDLHDLDGDHAAQGQAGEGELASRYLVEHPAGCLVPGVEDRERRLAPVRHDDLGRVLQRCNLRAIQTG
jgi:hypothetical protein